MKRRGVFALLVALAGLALLIGCQPAATANWAGSTDCKSCHSAETGSTYGALVAANKAGYENSGHFNGPRVLNSYVTSTGAIFEFEGSDAMYCNGSSCSKCHTEQGFISFMTTGTAGDQEPASPPGCFTCHKPHETGDFSLRTQVAVTLVDGTSYNYGAGNLCANCHQSRTASTAFLTGYATTTQSPAVPVKKWRSSDGAHHGVQSDFVLGKNLYAEGTNTYVATSAHIAGTGAPADSCVSCHKFDPATGNLSGSLELGGHGFYLTGEVHGAQKDVVALCSTCHTSMTSTDTTFEQSHHTAPADWDGANGIQDKLLEIKGLRNTLLSYFANAAKFPGGTPTPVVTPSGGVFTIGPSNEWNKDWIFNQSATQIQLDAPQSQAFWNLKLFVEDRSDGIHNPTFAAQILYDSIDIVNLDADHPGGLTKGTRPQ